MEHKIYICDHCDSDVNEKDAHCSHCGSMFDEAGKQVTLKLTEEDITTLQKFLGIIITSKASMRDLFRYIKGLVKVHEGDSIDLGGKVKDLIH